MESWKNGRRDLFDQLTKVCDRIGQDLVAGALILWLCPGVVLTISGADFHDRNAVRIGEEELRLLRDTSARVERLVERNAYLSDELDKWKEASSRVEDLERENRRLAEEVAQSLKQQQQQISGTPKLRFQAGTSSKSATPAPSDPKSSAPGMDSDLSKTMIKKEIHQSLIAKYNKVCEQVRVLDEVRKTIDDALRTEKEKTKRWVAWQNIQDADMRKKDDKIQRLEEEIERLRSRSNGEKSMPNVPLSRADGGSADQFDREVTRVVQVPMSSPIKGHEVPSATIEREGAGRVLDILTSFNQGKSPAPEEPDLPVHRVTDDMQVDDTDFEAIEARHTSSTQGSDPVSPNKATSQEQAPIEKPTSQRSSSPAIVEVRCIKKRKAPHGSQKIKTEVKVETISSSPIGLARLQYLDPNESLDLDDIGEKVVTPRKQRRVVELTRPNSRPVSLSPLAAKLRVHHESQCGSNTMDEGVGIASQETPVRHRHSILQPRSTNQQILPRTSEDRAPKKRRIASDEAVGELVEDGEIEAPASKSRRQAANTNDRLGGLLAKPSPPKRVLSPLLMRAGGQEPRSARTSVTSGLAREIQHLSQDEHDQIINFTSARLKDHFPSASRRRVPQSADSSRPSSRSSHAGSAEPTLPSSRTSLRESAGPSMPTSKGMSRGSEEPTRPTSKGTSRESLHMSPMHFAYLPPKRLLPADFAKASPRTPAVNLRLTVQHNTGSNKTATSNFRRSRNDIASDWDIDPDEEPLRLRPLNTLKRTDFKVNPNYNQGYNYAFSEVVRGRTARQECLQGCTKPECCGSKFRTLAEMERESRRRPTLSQEEADEMLLDEYMGDDAYKIRSMSKEQKEELIIQAMTRDMANKYGKHRHAYERRTSPPGFWRADFPTTQEEREDLAEAIEMERNAVEERYKEAMRPNGRFKFRDE